MAFDGAYGLCVFHRGMDLFEVFVPWAPPALVWLEARLPLLYRWLGEEWILCGEWLDRHSPLGYAQNAGFWAFDLFHRPTQRFIDTSRLVEFCEARGLAVNPVLFQGKPGDLEQALACLGRSRLGDGMAEGLILYGESGGWVEEQCKFVRADFEKWPLPEPEWWPIQRRSGRSQRK